MHSEDVTTSVSSPIVDRGVGGPKTPKFTGGCGRGPGRSTSLAYRSRSRQSVRVIDDLDDAAEVMRRAIAASLPTKLYLPSPCEGWTSRDVINHVVTGNLRTLAWTHCETGPSNEEDHLAGDPLAAFDASFLPVRARLADLVTRGAPVQTPFAELSAERLIDMRCTELVVHAWDVARSSGQPTDFVPELCKRLEAIARADIEGLDRAGSPFATERQPPPGASAADHLAAFFGRSFSSQQSR